MHKTITQAKKFLVVGALSTLINYGVFLLLYSVLSVRYLVASALGYTIGLLVGYFLNRSWTFTSVIPRGAVEFPFYLGVYVFSLVASLAVLRAVVDLSGWDPRLGNVFAIAVSTTLNFLGTKFLVFNERIPQLVRRVRGYFTLAFWFTLGIKVFASFFFASHFMTEGFVPFVQYFALTLRNPYDYFLAQGAMLFPYPAGMLFLMSLPMFFAQAVLPTAWLSSLPFQLFLLRIPILLLDILTYVLLCYLLPFKEKKVFWLYFASPILFYINYFHGQLDLVPTALLLLSIVMLFRGKESASFVTLGLGIATKTHLLAALPFYAVYLYRYRGGFAKIVDLVLMTLVTFGIANALLVSPGFVESVFNNPEQQRLFNLFVPFGFKDLRFLVAPAAIAFLLFSYASYKKLNRDSLLLMLGLTYTVLISLVPPMQGWFYWSLPFLVFFFAKFKNMPSVSFWTMNIFFILYFIFTQGSDVFESLRPLSAALASSPPPYELLARAGLNAQLLQNMLFTFLEASLIMTAFAAYRAGIASNKLYQGVKPLMFGIAGDSGVGKSRLAHSIQKLLHPNNLTLVAGDDVHKWERGHEQWSVTTHLNPHGNNVHLDLDHALAMLRGESVERPAYDHRTGTFTPPIRIEPRRFVLFHGLLTFVLERMRNLFHARFYIEADEDLRAAWKSKRDVEERNHTPDEVRAQIAERQKDATAFIHPQKTFADFVIRYMSGALPGRVAAEYDLKNSIFVDDLVEALSGVPELAVSHTYLGLERQRVSVSGQVSAKAIEEIAYRLYPKVIDTIESQPMFEDAIDGVNQLFFLAIVSSFYRFEHRDEH